MTRSRRSLRSSEKRLSPRQATDIIIGYKKKKAADDSPRAGAAAFFFFCGTLVFTLFRNTLFRYTTDDVQNSVLHYSVVKNKAKSALMRVNLAKCRPKSRNCVVFGAEFSTSDFCIFSQPTPTDTRNRASRKKCIFVSDIKKRAHRPNGRSSLHFPTARGAPTFLINIYQPRIYTRAIATLPKSIRAASEPARTLAVIDTFFSFFPCFIFISVPPHVRHLN